MLNSLEHIWCTLGYILISFRSGLCSTLSVFLFPKHTAFILMQMNLRCCYLNSNHCLILVYYWRLYHTFLSDLEQLGMSQYDFITSSCAEYLLFSIDINLTAAVHWFFWNILVLVHLSKLLLLKLIPIHEYEEGIVHNLKGIVHP